MWGGTHFFVHVNALVFTGPVEPSALDGQPGKPQQCLARFRPGDAPQPLTTYPAALFFLQTLRATGNTVHVMTEWSHADTALALRSLGLSRYCGDVRCLTRQPQTTMWTAASAACEASELAHSVFLVTSLSEWHELLRPQMIAVDHTQNGRATDLPFGSRALLYALCRCISLSEWRVRYPGTPVVCSLALTVSTLFNYCRFYAAPDLLDSELAALLASHGAVLVKSAREATHVLTRSAAEEEAEKSLAAQSPPSASSTASSSSFSSDSDSEDSDTLTSTTSSASDEDASPNAGAVAVKSGASARDARAPVGEPSEVVPTASDPVDDSRTYTLVTRGWVRESVCALRLLPTTLWQTDFEGVAEQAKQTGALLCAMLPPEDAKALPLTHFLRLAQHYHYPIGFLEDKDAGCVTAERVTFFFKELVHVTVDSAASGSAKPLRSNATASHTTSDGVWLCRNERRRDRTAVSAHVRLLASQFLFSMSRLKEEHRLAHTAGTQTGAPLTAQVGTNTDAAVELSPPVRSTESPPTPEPVTREEPSRPEPAEASTEADWRSHLKNVEGKLLKSDSLDEDRLFLTGEADPAAPGTTSIFSSAPVMHGGSFETGAPVPHSIFTAPPTHLGQALLPPPSVSGSFLAPPSSSASIFPAPPPPPPPSITQSGVDGALHAQTMPMSEGSSGNEMHTGPFTRCFIPTYQLPASEQEAVLAFVRSLPFFAKCPSNSVERDVTGLRCTFATPGGAAYFLSSAKLRFRGHPLEIFPLYRESAPLSLPHTVTAVHDTPTGGHPSATGRHPNVRGAFATQTGYAHAETSSPTTAASVLKAMRQSSARVTTPPVSSEVTEPVDTVAATPHSPETAPSSHRRRADPPPRVTTHPSESSVDSEYTRHHRSHRRRDSRSPSSVSSDGYHERKDDSANERHSSSRKPHSRKRSRSDESTHEPRRRSSSSFHSGRKHRRHRD